MRNNHLRALQQNHVDNGTMKIQVTSAVGMIPVEDARVRISYTGDPQDTLEQISTNADGQSEVLTLAAPPLEEHCNTREHAVWEFSAENCRGGD